MTSPFRDQPVPQMPGPGGPPSTYRLGRYDCVPATAGLNVGRATVGRLRRTGKQIREASPTARGQARGMSYNEIEQAVLNTSNGTLSCNARFGIANADLKALADAGRSGGVSIDTRITAGTSRRTGSFRGFHTVGWYDYRWVTTRADCYCEKDTGTDHGEFLIEDPGTTTTGYKWWSASLLYRAAQARTGGHGINVLVFPDTEGRTKVARDGGNIRSAPNTTAKILGTFAKGASFRVLRTVNGGGWKRSNGTTAYGWQEVLLTNGTVAYIKGEELNV